MSAERTGRVAGIVLAAGASTRMGRNKLFMQLEGESLLRRVVRLVSAAGLDPVVVVLGHEAGQARDELVGLGCEPVLNPDYERGVNTSVRAGIQAVRERAAAVVVVLADMPLVTSDMIAALVERYRHSDAPLVISEYGGVNAPPMLYDRTLFDELLSMEGEGCGKQVVKRHRSEALSLSWPTEALTDLDEPNDYERVKGLVEARAQARPYAR